MIYVLHETPLVRDAIRAALQELGPVRATGLWSEIAGDLISGSSRDDVLVTDLKLRAISGTQLVEILRRYNPALRIVLCTPRPDDAPPGIADVIVREQRGYERLKAEVRKLAPSLIKAKSSGRLRVVELLRDDGKASDSKVLST